MAQEIVVAGGGDFNDTPQQTVVVQPAEPTVVIIEQDNTAVWVAGVAVPLIIAIVGWWLQARWRKQHPGMELTLANIKKSREK